jgi:hypothetical protein
MTAEELKQFVLDYCDGSIWTDRDVPENMLSSVFFPLMFMGEESLLEEDVKETGLVYANTRKDRTCGMSINGYPIFFSCRMVHKDDVELVTPVIKEELKRREQLDSAFQTPMKGLGYDRREPGSDQTLLDLQEEDAGGTQSPVRSDEAVDGGLEGRDDQQANESVGE